MDYHSSATLGELTCYQACALNGIFTTANSVRKMFDSEGMEIAQARAILGDDVFLPVGVEFDVSFHSITCYCFCLQRFDGTWRTAHRMPAVFLSQVSQLVFSSHGLLGCLLTWWLRRWVAGT